MTFRVLPIEPARLAAIIESGRDHLGNPVQPWPVEGWEPLRCCLRIAEPDDQIALVAYRPFDDLSPWSEVGPVFVHTAGCQGYDDPARLPQRLRTGPRILRTYHADCSMDYADITLVPAGEDIESALTDLLRQPGVAFVHVRSATAQCFTYEVRSAGDTPVVA